MHTIVPGESSHQGMTSTALVASLQLQQLNRSRSVSDRYPAFAAHAMSTSSQRGKLATLAGNQRQFSRSISAQDPENNTQGQTVTGAGPAVVEEETGKSFTMSAAGGWDEAYAGGSSSAGPQRNKDVDVAAAKASRDQGGRVGATDDDVLPAAAATSTRSPLRIISNNIRRPMLHQARSMGQLRSPPKGFLNLPSDNQNEDQKQSSSSTITGRPSLQNSPLRERRCKQPLSIKAPPPPSLSSASVSGATTPTTLLRRPRARSVTSSSYIYSPPPCPPPTTPLPELPPNSAMLGGGGSGSASGSSSKHSNSHSNGSTTTTSSETPLSSVVATTPYKPQQQQMQQSSDDRNPNRAARGWLQDERTPPPPPPLVLSASSDYSCSSSPSPASATSSKYSPIGLRLLHGQDMQRGISAPAHPTAWTRTSIDFKEQGSGGTNSKAIPWSHNQDYIFDRLGLSFAQQLDLSTTTTPTIAQNDAATNALLHSRISLDAHTTTTKEDVYDDNLHVYGLAM